MAIEVLLVERVVTTFGLPVPSLERKGHPVSLAHTRRQATSCSRSLQPDILIVDVASFGAGGYDVLDDVRSRLNGVPIILLEVGHAVPSQPCLRRTVRGVDYRFEQVEPAPQATGTSANRRVEPGEPRRKPIAR